MCASVASPACKHFQKQHESRPVAVEECCSCSVRRSLQHPLQLPATSERMQRKLSLASLASDSSLMVMRVAALELAEPFWDGHNLLLSEGIGEGEEGSAHSHPTLRCCSWQGRATGSLGAGSCVT